MEYHYGHVPRRTPDDPGLGVGLTIDGRMEQGSEVLTAIEVKPTYRTSVRTWYRQVVENTNPRNQQDLDCNYIQQQPLQQASKVQGMSN